MIRTQHLIALLSGAALIACSSTPKQPAVVEQTVSGDTTTQVDPNAFPDEPEEKPVELPPPPVLEFPDEAFRAEQPKAGPPRPFTAPKVATFKIGGQIDAYLVERHELPTISMRLQFEGGSVNDPKAKVGMASMCMSMLTEGTEKLDKLAYKAALADIASSVSARAGSEQQTISMSTLTRNFDTTFGLFRDTLMTPGFRATDLDRMVKRSLQSLAQRRKSAASVARRVASNVLYGPNHPFGFVETEKTLQAITIDDCKKYHAAYLRPRRAKLFVVGDITQAELKAKFGELLKEWKGTPKRSVRMPKPRTRVGKVFFVNIKGANQSSISVRYFGPKRKDRGYFANSAMSALIGGSFSARLNMNLRENKGYSYGAFGGLNYSRNYGVFFAGASVRANTTRQSLLEIYNDIEQFKSGKRPATEAELTRDRNGAVLGVPARFATARQSLGTYSRLVYYGLPLNYYSSYAAKVSAVTPKQVAAAAKRHLRPQNAVVIVVGDADAPQIEHKDGKDVPLLKDGKPVTLKMALEDLVASGRLGKGKLVVLDADGNAQ